MNTNVVPYTKLVSANKSSGFTAPSNGWMSGAIQGADQGSTVIYIDGVEVASTFNRYRSKHPFFCPIQKGQTITWTGAEQAYISFFQSV